MERTKITTPKTDPHQVKVNREPVAGDYDQAVEDAEKGPDGVFRFVMHHRNKLAAGAFFLTGLTAVGTAHAYIEGGRADSAAVVAEYKGGGEQDIREARKEAKREWTMTDTVDGFVDTFGLSKGQGVGSNYEAGMEVESAIEESIPTQIAMGAQVLSVAVPIAGGACRKVKDAIESDRAYKENSGK